MNRVTSIGGGSLPPDEPHVAQADREQQARFERAMRPAREQKMGLSQPEREQSARFKRTMPHGQEPQADFPQAEQKRVLSTVLHEPLQKDGSRQEARLEGLPPHRFQAKDKKQKGEQEPSTDPNTRWQEGDDEQESLADLAPLLSLSAAPLPQGQTDPSPATREAGHQPGAEPHQEAQMAIPARDASLPEVNELSALLATEVEEDRPADPLPTPPSQPILPLARTPGDLQLARVTPPDPSGELGRLLERLTVDIQLELGRPERPPLLRLNLPELGELAIRIARHPGELQVEILATSQGQLLLNQGRNDLLDRLQRLYPGEQIALDLFAQGDSEQGSRQRRSIYEEWEVDA